MHLQGSFLLVKAQGACSRPPHVECRLNKRHVRFILANTEVLHRKLTDTAERVRQLEDALRIAQSTISSTPHPLLRSELLEVKYAAVLEINKAPGPEVGSSDDVDKKIMQSFRNLTLAQDGSEEEVRIYQSRKIGFVTYLHTFAIDLAFGKSMNKSHHRFTYCSAHSLA